MSRIEYRAVHTRAPWRKVRNHSSLDKAKYGPNGARSLLSGGIKARVDRYGPVSCVVVWEHGATEGFILRVAPDTGEVEERPVPMEAVLRYEARGEIPAAEISRWFKDAKATETNGPRPAPGGEPGGKRAPDAPRGRPAVRRVSTGRLTVERLEETGRVRLSRSFFMRDFLHSEIAEIYGLLNAPDDVDLAVSAGTRLCEELLEPIQERFGRIAVRSAYRSSAVNELGNRNGHNCARNESNYAAHIWDRRDGQGRMGATACIVVPPLVDYAANGGSWTEMAWWIHDHLPYSKLQFFPKLLAFNVRWREEPERVISSYVEPKGTLTRPGMANHQGDHAHLYEGLLTAVTRK